VRGSLLVAMAAAASLWVAAKDKPEWREARVVWSNSELDSPVGIYSAGGVTQTAREQFDLDSGDVVYTVEQWVVPQRRLRLEEGTTVQFAIEGKNVLLKLGKGKPRKLRVVATYPKKSEKQPRAVR
jgi:hypothetical protein